MRAPSPDKLVETYTRISLANQRILAKLTQVLTLFHAQGIDCILLKGADILPRLYGVRGVRPMTDADLLVHERDLPAIDAILTGLGFLPQIDGNPVYRDQDSHLLLDMITEVWYSDDLEGIWKRAIQRTMAGLQVKGMGTDDLLIYLTAYSVLHRGHFQPSFAQDLALLARKEGLHWDFIVREARRLHLKIPLYHGLSHASLGEFSPIPGRILPRLAPTNLAEKAWLALLRTLVTDRQVTDIGHLLMLVPLPWSLKWRRLKEVFWPSPAFLKYRYGEESLSVPVWTRVIRVFQLSGQALSLGWRVLGRLVSRREGSA